MSKLLHPSLTLCINMVGHIKTDVHTSECSEQLTYHLCHHMLVCLQHQYILQTFL